MISVYYDTLSFLYHQVKERREKRNSRNHLFRDYGSKGRGREAHPEFLVVWVVQTCRGVVKTFFEVVFSSDINTTFTTRSCHRKGTFLCLQRQEVPHMCLQTGLHFMVFRVLCIQCKPSWLDSVQELLYIRSILPILILNET